MSVGDTINEATMNQNLSSLAVQLRNLMWQIQNLSLGINGQGSGLAVLEALGYDSGDAATALELIAYMNTVAGVYYGSTQAGGSGGTGAVAFNYNQALSQLWVGQ